MSLEEALIATLRDKLRGHPGEMFVLPSLIAAMDEDEQLFIIHCDTTGKSEEELNKLFQDGLSFYLADRTEGP